MRKGDPLSPFLFILVIEGMVQMMKKAVDLSLFLGFKVNDEVSYNIVQFAGGTLIIGNCNGIISSVIKHY